MLQKLRNFGALVIGAQAAKEQEKAVREGRTKFGPLVVGDRVVEGTNTPAGDSRAVGSQMSAERTLELLERQPTMTLIYLNAELSRRSGPRHKVLVGIKAGLEAGTLSIVDPATSAEDQITRIVAVLATMPAANSR